MFQRVSEVHGHATRSAVNNMSRSTRDKGSLSYRVPKEWSELPDDLRKIKSKATFKTNSKMLIIKKYSEYQCCQIGCKVCEGGGGGDGIITSQRGPMVEGVGGSVAVETGLRMTS